MQWSVSSGKYGILQRATFLAFGDSLDHTADYPLADMTASGNEWVRTVGRRIWVASKSKWRFSDRNNTTVDIADADLSTTVNDYSLPTTAFDVDGVSVLDANGDYVKLKRIDRTELSVDEEEFMSTPGLPQYYDIDGYTLWIYPMAASGSVTVANGLKIHLSRDTTTFSVPASYTTADTTTPGFDTDFHDIVCYGIAHDYLRGNDQKKADDYLAYIERQKLEIDSRFGMKNREAKDNIRPMYEDYS